MAEGHVPVLSTSKRCDTLNSIVLGIGPATWTFDLRFMILKEPQTVSAEFPSELTTMHGPIVGTESGAVFYNGHPLPLLHENLVTATVWDERGHVVSCGMDSCVSFHGVDDTPQPIVPRYHTSTAGVKTNPPFPNCADILPGHEGVVLVGCGDGTVLSFVLSDVWGPEGDVNPDCTLDAQTGSAIVAIRAVDRTRFGTAAHNGCVTLWDATTLLRAKEGSGECESCGEIASLRFVSEPKELLNDMCLLHGEGRVAVATTVSTNVIQVVQWE
jgi:hypothetical protein